MARKDNNISAAFQQAQQQQVPIEEQYRDAARRGMIPRPVRMVRGDEELAPGTSPMQPGGAPYLVRDGAGMAPIEKDEPAPAADDVELLAAAAEVVADMPVKQAIGKEQVREAMRILRKYKDGKKMLEEKIVRNEKWWKMRHWDLLKDPESIDDPRPASGWLFNCIISKHADFMDSFPGVDILPREEGDKEEAERLSSIIPVIMEHNGYEQIYSDEVWYKLKNGTGVYGVFWTPSKHNGLGDITIRSMDLLGLFWEPGVTDIQDSQHFFSVELVDNSILEEQYPECRDQLGHTKDTLLKKYWYDENIDTTGKSAVVDWYYHKVNSSGKRVLHYCKFVDEIVLYATENDTKVPTRPEAQGLYDEYGNPAVDENGQPVAALAEVPTGAPVSERGWYDHGLYPFVFDVLFKEEGMPVGFGFVDICKHAQASIDQINNAFEKNIQFVANPRYIVRSDGSINEEEFVDPKRILVHADGNLGQDSIRPIDTPMLVNSNYIGMLEQKISELKETAGNRDTNNGATMAGVTAASAIAAMQESSGKTSRDQIKTTYRAHEKVVNMVIELIRQFYDMPRQFRIIGKRGEEQYVTYSNAGLLPQAQGVEYGVDMGYRLPVFDIRVEAEKESAYSQLSQNELALQFYNNGFFNPQYADQVLACLDMMSFTGKPAVIAKVQENGGMYQQMLQMQQQMMQMSQVIDQLTGSNLAPQLAQQINGGAYIPPDVGGGTSSTQLEGSGLKENKRVAAARAQASEATQPR